MRNLKSIYQSCELEYESVNKELEILAMLLLFLNFVTSVSQNLQKEEHLQGQSYSLIDTGLFIQFFSLDS